VIYSVFPTAIVPTPSGSIHLILLSQKDPFYREIPTAIVTSLLNPTKVPTISWMVRPRRHGDLKDGQGNEIALNGELVDQGVYRYIVPGPNVLAHA
jgi:hypothetical protein